MSEGQQPSSDDPVATTTPNELKERIDAGEDVFVLDVRSEDDFDEWHIEGETVDIVNYPYFNLLDGIPAELHEELPENRPITVLCAKGGSSELVAEHLRDEGYDVDHLERGMKGWARIYEYTELDVGTDATVAQYQRPSSGCLAYLVVSDGEAAVVDPLRAFTDEYQQDARALGAEITYALDTHVHADHVSGVRDLARETDATAVIPEAADARGVDYDQSYETVAHGESIAVGDVEVDVDGLFTESVARPDLEDPEAAKDAARTLYESLQERVLTRPAETVVAPAHFSDAATAAEDGTYTAALGDLEADMAALSMDEAEFVEFIVADMPPRPANYEDIIATNLGQQSPDDETAMELELGPNNCAASEEALTN